MNKLVNNILSFFKKNKKKMDTQRLISLKENFTGQKFQWIKTNDVSLRGKIVKCKDVEPRGNMFMIYFNDGSKIEERLLNRNLMLISEGMSPLSKEEINSINGPVIPSSPSSKNEGPIKMPDDLKQFQTPNVPPTSPETGTLSKQAKPKEKNVQTTNMFSMFNAEETLLNIQVNLKLPNKKLLKMMYENADNKETFLSDLSQYVYSKINNNVVKDSLKKTIKPSVKITRKTKVSISKNEPLPSKKDTSTNKTVEVTEIKNEK